MGNKIPITIYAIAESIDAVFTPQYNLNNETKIVIGIENEGPK